MKLSYFLYTLFITTSLCFSTTSYALVFPLPSKDNDIIGNVQETIAAEGDNFHTIGRHHDVGYYELIEANPDVNPDDTPEGTPITIPTRFILPKTPRQGIVINLPELRLYYF